MKTLKELRLSENLTQDDVADLFGVAPRTIQYAETDSSRISNKLLARYTSAFNLKRKDIFLGNKKEIAEFHNKNREAFIFAFKNKHEGEVE